VACAFLCANLHQARGESFFCSHAPGERERERAGGAQRGEGEGTALALCVCVCVCACMCVRVAGAPSVCHCLARPVRVYADGGRFSLSALLIPPFQRARAHPPFSPSLLPTELPHPTTLHPVNHARRPGGGRLHGQAGRAGGAVRRDDGRDEKGRVRGVRRRRRRRGAVRRGAQPAVCGLQERHRRAARVLAHRVLHRAEGGGERQRGARRPHQAVPGGGASFASFLFLSRRRGWGAAGRGSAAGGPGAAAWRGRRARAEGGPHGWKEKSESALSARSLASLSSLHSRLPRAAPPPPCVATLHAAPAPRTHTLVRSATPGTLVRARRSCGAS
jgi:hypothetical protein